MFRKLLYIVVIIGGILIVLVGPIDTDPIKEKSFYKDMMTELDTLQLKEDEGRDSLRAGWNLFSLVPDHVMPMAGYAPRDSFNQVHDSCIAGSLRSIMAANKCT